MLKLLLGFTLFVLPFSKSLLEIGMASVIAVWLVQKIVLRKPIQIPRLLVWLMLAFVAVHALSLLSVPKEHLQIGIRGFVKCLKFSLLFLAAADTLTDSDGRKYVIAAYLSGAAIVVLNGIYQMFSGTDLIRQYSVDIPGRLIRMKSTFSSPNGLAGYLLPAVTLAFGSWLRQGRWNSKSILYAASAALSFIGLVSTLSRAALFAFVLALLVLFVSQKKFIWVLVLIAALGALTYSSPYLKENFVDSLSRKDITISERGRFWGASLRMIQEKPILGHGANQYFRLFPEFADKDETYRGYAHNCFLQMACEIGLIGLVLFLIPLLIYLPRGFGTDAALATGLTAFLIHSAFDTHFYAIQLAALFWISWGFLIAGTRKPEEDTKL